MLTVEPPACPASTAAVADELEQLAGRGDMPAFWEWMGRLQTHCDQIDRIRRG